MRRIIFLILCGALAYGAISARPERSDDRDSTQKRVTIVERGIALPLTIGDGSIEEALAQTAFALADGDRTIPPRTTMPANNAVIEVLRQHTVEVVVDGQSQSCVTDALRVGDVPATCGIAFREGVDTIVPNVMTPVRSDMAITLRHFEEREEVRTVRIPFKTVRRNDAKRAFGTITVVQKGRSGRVRVTERVTYNGGKEVARTEIARDVVMAPVDEIIAVGTKVRLGKKHKGQASWYAYKGCDCAANPWLPKGSYAKVTNRANGKSVIVRINDRGPFVPGRIIDLDVVAFKKIASKGAGVIDVIMEEVK